MYFVVRVLFLKNDFGICKPSSSYSVYKETKRTWNNLQITKLVSYPGGNNSQSYEKYALFYGFIIIK